MFWFWLTRAASACGKLFRSLRAGRNQVGRTKPSRPPASVPVYERRPTLHAQFQCQSNSSKRTLYETRSTEIPVMHVPERDAGLVLKGTETPRRTHPVTRSRWRRRPPGGPEEDFQKESPSLQPHPLPPRALHSPSPPVADLKNRERPGGSQQQSPAPHGPPLASASTCAPTVLRAP